jgi:hypothetical protein
MGCKLWLYRQFAKEVVFLSGEIEKQKKPFPLSRSRAEGQRLYP